MLKRVVASAVTVMLPGVGYETTVLIGSRSGNVVIPTDRLFTQKPHGHDPWTSACLPTPA